MERNSMANIISSMKITNPIKEMVSKSKKRFIDDDYNLDLSCKFFVPWNKKKKTKSLQAMVDLSLCACVVSLYYVLCHFMRACAWSWCRLRASRYLIWCEADGGTCTRTCDITYVFVQRFFMCGIVWNLLLSIICNRRYSGQFDSDGFSSNENRRCLSKPHRCCC